MLIYDGDCGFCTSSARWLEARLPLGYPVVAWQSLDDLDALGLNEARVRKAAFWIGTDGTPHAGARAIARALVACRGAWSILGWLLLVPPISWLATIGYALIARYRHRLPGRAACSITPPAEETSSTNAEETDRAVS